MVKMEATTSKENVAIEKRVYQNRQKVLPLSLSMTLPLLCSKPTRKMMVYKENLVTANTKKSNLQ